jgi:hypothetical protein
MDHRNLERSHQFLVHCEGCSYTREDSWFKEGDIDAEMVRVYFEELEKEKGDNKAHKVGTQTTTPSPKSTGGRSMIRTKRRIIIILRLCAPAPPNLCAGKCHGRVRIREERIRENRIQAQSKSKMENPLDLDLTGGNMASGRFHKTI